MSASVGQAFLSRKGSPLWTRRGKVIKDHVAHADNVLRTLDYQHELCLVFTVASIPSRLSATNRRIGVVLVSSRVVLRFFPPYDVRFLRLCCSVGDDVRFSGDDVRSCI